MPWLFNRQPENIVGADGEGISPEVAIREIYKLSRLSIGYEDVAEDSTIRIMSYLMNRWEQEQISGVSTTSPRKAHKSEKFYKPEWNRAFQIIHLTHEELEPFKEEWVSDYRSGKRNLDNQRMIVWYGEEVFIFAFDHDSSYVATIPRMLFDYEYEDLESLFELLDSNRSLKKESFRKRKENFMNHFTKGTPKHPRHWIGDFLKVKDDNRETQNAFPSEKRFVSQPLTDNNFHLLMYTLEKWKPLRPTIEMPEEVVQGIFNPVDLNLEEIVMNQVKSDSLDAIERGRMIALISRPFLSGVLKAMRLKPLEEKAEVPEFSLKDWSDSQGTPPVDPGNLSPSDKDVERIAKALRKRKIERKNYSHKSVIVEVRREERLMIQLDKPTTVRMKLKRGEGIIKVKGRNDKGELPLDVHFIPWDASLIDLGSQKYVTLLPGDRKLEFNVTYDTDSSGNLIGATVDIDYSKEPHEKRIGVRAKSSLRDISQWMLKEPVTAAAGVVVLALSTFLYILISREASISNSTIAKGASEQSLISTASDVSKQEPKIRPIRSGKEEKIMSGDKDRNLASYDESRLFLYSEGTGKLIDARAGDKEWRLSIKRKPRESAATLKDVRVRIVDVTTGADVEVGKSEDGRITLPAMRAGVYNLKVEKQGSNFSQKIQFPIDKGTYVELKKESPLPNTKR